MTLEQFLRKQREALEISQNQMAEALGYESGQFISNMDRSICSLPSGKFKAASDLLGIPLSVMIDMRGEDVKRKLEKELL